MIVTVSVAVVAHWPALGVKVYVPVLFASKAGLHVPVIPLVDDAGNGLAPPAHCAGIAVKVGVTCGLIVTVSVAVVAHWPALGVKVYVPVLFASKAGLHVPVIPLLDDAGNGLVLPHTVPGSL